MRSWSYGDADGTTTCDVDLIGRSRDEVAGQELLDTYDIAGRVTRATWSGARSLPPSATRAHDARRAMAVAPISLTAPSTTTPTS